MNNTTTPFTCVINNKITKAQFGESECIIGNLAATLYKYDLGYFSMAPLGVIIFISIFGGIKQNYRWFILNQAVWDLCKSYEFSCNNFLANYVKPSPTCFYYSNKGAGPLDTTIGNIIFDNIYVPLVLLSTTRFIGLYFTNFYDKLTEGYRIIFTIVLFNLFFLIFQTEYLISVWMIVPRGEWLVNECLLQHGPNSTTLCTSKTNKQQDFFYNFFVSLFSICFHFRQINPAICSLISSFSTWMIILKVAKQAKFQLKHNRRDFFNSARIAVVISSQTVMTSFIFVISFFKNFQTFVSIFSNISVVNNQNYIKGKNYTEVIDFRLPLWIDGTLGLTGLGGQQIVTQIRIFIESIIILSIMTGYREAIVKFFKKLYLLFRSPRKFIKSFGKTTPQNSWT